MDLDRLFQTTFNELESPTTSAVFPGFPGDGVSSGKEQTIDKKDISRLSRISRPESRGLGSDQLFGSGNIEFSDIRDRAKSVLSEVPGNPGKPGKQGKKLAETDTYLFPLEEEKTGKPGKFDTPSEGHLAGMNCAAPQRSDLWTSPTVAETDHVAPPVGDPLPVSADAVRAGVEREMCALAEAGRVGPAALSDAVEVTRAKIRNSEALAERQASGAACHACDGPLDDTLPVVAVLTGRRGAHLFMHAGCCGAWSARRIALVDSIMAAAGYGAEAEGHLGCISL